MWESECIMLTLDRTKITETSPSELNFSKRQLKYVSKH